MAPGPLIFMVKLVPAASPRHDLSTHKELVTGRPCIHIASRLFWAAPVCHFSLGLCRRESA